MIEVKATNKYKKLKVVDTELKRIPEENEVFKVTKERLKVLKGDNPYKAVFVEEVIKATPKKKDNTKKNDTKK